MYFRVRCGASHAVSLIRRGLRPYACGFEMRSIGRTMVSVDVNDCNIK